ncbi:helix-turn-helix domain-containing protein [Streptomyces sp. NBC_00459]|uniref:helix-turn-helix domain-containing protein n=1 Tax=Streptomyces sp. NBC_00459 TaxID=2975749 RepID=UPI002E16EE77
MDTQNPSAPPCAQSRPAGKNHPRRGPNSGVSGVIHDNVRHTTRFTVIGNHLAQHAELSLLAIGLGAHIQSLPPGAPVDIKTLAKRFPEGTTRIAAALRELETHGYLRRTRERTPTGNIVTRTVSCNRPGHRAATTAADNAPKPPARRATPAQKPPRRALPDVPKPSYPYASLIQKATDLLVGLRRHDHRLLLSTTDTEHLAPGVAAWLERDLVPTAVQEALTTRLPPGDLHRPAALLAHRLAAQLPPPPPLRAPAGPSAVRHPLRNCDSCDRAYRGPEPGRCGDCRTAAQPGAHHL